MTATQYDMIAELQRANDALRRERDAARAQRDTALARRNSEYDERIAHQAATIDVLKAMSASPGDPQSVFDLIAGRARDICDAYGVTVCVFDGSLLHWRASTGVSEDPAVRTAAQAEYPRPPARDWPAPRVILDRAIVHIRDHDADPELRRSPVWDTVKSSVGVPMMRGGVPIGTLHMGSREKGGFSDTQVDLLKAFAEQAVIAIQSAETYRALQTRTADLQEALEYQTAVSNVLKVISRSTFDLQLVLQTLVETAAALCGAEMAFVLRREGEVFRAAASIGFSDAYQDFLDNHPITVGRGSVTGRVALERRAIQIADVVADPEYTLTESTTLSGQRTALGVPLMREDELIGVIVLARRRVEPFADRQIELVSTFADQAVIGIENTRLITEQREALEQQTATAEVLQVINANPGNLTPVFDAVLEKAMRLCDAAFGSLYTYDGENFHDAAQRGVPAAYAELRAKSPPSARQESPLGRLLETKRAVHVPDLRLDQGFQAGGPLGRALSEVGGARTALMVPLLKENAVQGFISIYRPEPRPFSGKQIALVENFAAQAIIAMENARLLTEQREALEQQTATAEVLQAINASPGNLTPVFDAMLEKAIWLCGATGGIFWNVSGDIAQMAATRGYPAPYEAFLKTPFKIGPHTGIARLLHGEDLVHIDDLAAGIGYASGDPLQRAAVDLANLRTLVAVPLRKDGVLIGAIVLGRLEVHPFTGRQIALLQNFAAQAVIAMENARLINEQREALEQQTATAEVLQVINANPGNLAPVFDAMMEKVTRLCEAHSGFLWTYDGERYHVASTRNLSPAFEAFLSEPRVPGPTTGIARLASGEAIVHFEDTIKTDAYRSGDPLVRATAELGGFRTVLIVPMRKDGMLLGGFSIDRQEVRPFAPKQIELVRTFAGQAEIAMENARLLGELRTALDITQETLRELKVAQANLIQAEKMASLGQLTAGIAHEIKNPLNFVNNFAELSVDLLGELKEAIAPAEAALNPDQRDEVDDVVATLTGNLQKINEHGKRADSIVKAMLEHSRGASPERRTVDINALADEALNLAYHGARAQDQSFNITLERDFGDGIVPIELNPQDITRVLLNIFHNGFYAANKQARSRRDNKFTPTLKLTTRGNGDAVEIRVRDNGTGIPAEIRDKLFQPFFTTKPTGEGTGLGLSITYDIVTKAHGGTVTVDSEVGEFTEFVVTLPRQMFGNEDARA